MRPLRKSSLEIKPPKTLKFNLHKILTSNL